MQGSTILHTTLSKWAKEFGSKPFIIETNTGREISYREFDQSVAILRKQFGDKPKTIIMALSSGIINATVWIAALTSGHLIIPVDPRTTEFEFTQLIDKHFPDIFITEEEMKQSPSIKYLTASQLEEIIRNHANNSNQQSQFVPSEGSVYLSSSGSTGTPKGMILSATKTILTGNYIRERHELTANDRGLTPLPFYHVNAPIVSLITSILSGSTLIIATKFSTSHFWEWVEQYNPTWISVVPTIVAMLLSTERPDFLDHASLRFIRTASAPLPIINLKRFEEKFRIPVLETYGISEAGSTIAANPLPPKVHKPGSVGTPLGVTMRICEMVDDTLQPVPDGKVGEVCIKGESVITRYEKNAGKDSFVDGWFRTGDLGYFDNDGYLFLTGRIKDIIIRGGENIAPREIEEVLLEFPCVNEAAVVGQPDPIYGEKVVAFVVMEDRPSLPVNEAAIKNFVATKLSRPKVPEQIHILTELPRGRTGKINKQLLKTQLTI